MLLNQNIINFRFLASEVVDRMDTKTKSFCLRRRANKESNRKKYEVRYASFQNFFIRNWTQSFDDIFYILTYRCRMHLNIRTSQNAIHVPISVFGVRNRQFAVSSYRSPRVLRCLMVKSCICFFCL